jgi:hypothetical protein
MIFGFNTDIRHGDAIYHVQSEAREGEQLLQTQVFMRGRCIGTRAVSYAASASDAAFGDTQKEAQLRDLHRAVLEAIREGRLETALDLAEGESFSTVKPLDILWENAASVHAADKLVMRLLVTDAGVPAPHARLTFRFSRPDVAPFYTQAVTDPSGYADLSLDVNESALPDSSVMIQASHDGRTVTRKFVLQKTDQ